MNGPPDLPLAAFHWVEYIGLLGGIGSFVVRRLGRQPPAVAWARPPMAMAFAAAAAGGAGVLVQSPSLPTLLRVIVELSALVACVRGIRVVAPLAVLGCVLLAPAGHAAGIGPLGPGAGYIDAVHVLAAGMWAGGVVALGSLRPPAGWTAPDARQLIGRFAPVAAVAFALTALTGVLRAVGQVGEVTQLWTTQYGVILLLKCAGVVVMLALAPAWTRRSGIARLEAVAAIFVVALTALLAAFPLPVN